MLWTGNAISPLDPMLYEHNMNFPNNTSYDEERLQDVSAPYVMPTLRHCLSSLCFYSLPIRTTPPPFPSNTNPNYNSSHKQM